MRDLPFHLCTQADIKMVKYNTYPLTIREKGDPMNIETSWITENWYILLGILLALFIVVRVVKSVLKWIFIFAILIGVAVYGIYMI
jgi:hypothetical protein